MGRVSRDARLLFIQLWTLVDDSGRTRAASQMLASLLYPYDADAPSLLTGWLLELEREGCIVRYRVGADSFLQVVKWAKHQKIDRPTPSRIPEFDESSMSAQRALDESPTNADENSMNKGDAEVFDEPSTSPRDWTSTLAPPEGKGKDASRGRDEDSTRSGGECSQSPSGLIREPTSAKGLRTSAGQAPNHSATAQGDASKSVSERVRPQAAGSLRGPDAQKPNGTLDPETKRLAEQLNAKLKSRPGYIPPHVPAVKSKTAKPAKGAK